MAETDPDHAAPEWVHLLPSASGPVHTADSRGPYHVTDAAALMAASLPPGERLPIDENHATDLAAPQGLPAPARGWIVELQARADGIWGRVEWTPTGRQLLAERAYRAISPVILHDQAKTVSRILRASLVNRPNLRGMAALNQETAMTLAAIAVALGLPEGATEDDILSAIRTMRGTAEDMPAAQSALAEVATLLGVPGAAPAEVVTAARTAGTAAPAVVSLQAEVAALTQRLNAQAQAQARHSAEAFVDGAIRRGVVGVKPLREHYIARHMVDAASVETEIAALPVLSGAVRGTAQPPETGRVALNAEEQTAARLLGLTHEQMIAARAAGEGAAQ